MLLLLAPAALAQASDDAATTPATTTAAGPASQDWNLHAQFTNVTQYHPAFTSPYQGANSLDPGNNGRETSDVTLYAGARLWTGAEFYADAEVDQGYGLSTTLGVAGFPSGEAYKVGARNPYFRLPRAFVRQVIAQSAAGSAAQADAANALAGRQYEDSVTITLGKFSVVDIFDANRYAHDPRGDFMNWAIIDGGAFDYAADAWGYTYGGAIEWTRARWTLRAGAFALSQIPNSKDIDGQFHQFELLGEVEERYAVGSHPGKGSALVFLNHARMGQYSQAIALGLAQGSSPDTSQVRRYQSRPGIALNFEQELGPDLGAFLRASANDGNEEAFEFTEINRSLAAGLSLQGGAWNRADDTLGLAMAVNALSAPARAYFAAGGLGILIGDGRLNYGREQILETYYAGHLASAVTLSTDVQFVRNPAYNRDRGPVTVFGLRLHAAF